MKQINIFGGCCCWILVAGCQLTSTLEPPVLETSFAGVQTQREAAEAAATTSDDAVKAPSEALESNGATQPSAAPTLLDRAANPLQLTVSQAPNEDIWQHIADQIELPVPSNKRIQNQLNWYLKHPNYMQRVNKRATPFLYHIVSAIEERNLPMELALLPIVESAFDPFAYSHGRAAGMWQFIPATGTRFGMKQNWWYDGRRDVLLSTKGALDYLTYLHKTFSSDWLHALAAYNSGEGRVAKAIKKNKRSGKKTDFWSLDLPKETRAYVPKLLALSHLLKNSQDYDFSWPQLANRSFTTAVDVGSQIDLALAAEMADLTVEALHLLNPGFNRWATDPNGPHRLLIPNEKVGKFTDSLAETSQQQRLNWVRHTVHNGDSLIKIAKRYHSSVDVIQKVNKIAGTRIITGAHLLIPVALRSLADYPLSQGERLKSIQNLKRGSHKLEHLVRAGDTFWDLSRSYNVAVRNLAKWNGMAPTDTLRPGQRLAIWVDQGSSQPTAHGVIRSLTYTVRSGDSLAKIAHKFKVAIVDITRWNQLNRKHYLHPGQKLKLLVDVTDT